MPDKDNVKTFLNGTDIPTIRRLDYIVHDTDPMESGYLYAALRNLALLGIYSDQDSDFSDDYIKEAYERVKPSLRPKLEWVNHWMEENGKEPFFTDYEDWKAVAKDYVYFWKLRTKRVFVEEEVTARRGESGRTPVPWLTQKLEELVQERMNM